MAKSPKNQNSEAAPIKAEKPKFKLPKKLAECADRLYQLREQQRAMQKEVDKIDEECKALKEHIINNLPKSNASGVSGMVANVSIVPKVAVRVTDWDAFYGYIKKSKLGFSLLQKRPSDSLVKELWEDGKSVPGVEPFQYVDVSCTKV